MNYKSIICAILLVCMTTLGHSQIVPEFSLSMEDPTFKSTLIFSFHSSTTSWSEVRLLNIRGETILSAKLESIKGKNDVRINGINMIPSGPYTLQVRAATGEIVSRKIKKV